MTIPLMLALTLGLSLAVPPPRAEAGVGRDEVRALYASRFAFDRRGVPLISVRLMEGQQSVTVGATVGVHLLPFGAGATRIGKARSWTVTVKDARPARVRYWVVLERVAGSLSRKQRRQLHLRWKARGEQIRVLERGTLFAVGGRVVDHRTSLVVSRSGADPARAARVARQLARLHGRRTTVFAELLRRPRGRILARPEGSTLEVNNTDVVWFVPEGAGRLMVRQVEHGRGYAWHGRKDRQYFGRIYVTVDRLGRLVVVNEVPADKLLSGLVPAELPNSAPLEALKAQAVAARGQLLAKIGTRHAVDPYLICASQHCQVYRGAGRELRRTSQAVGATRGQILVGHKGRLADTVYSACCGGLGEHNEHVWNTPKNPILRGRLDLSAAQGQALKMFAHGVSEPTLRAWLEASPAAYCNRAMFGKNDRFRWRKRLRQSELDALVKRRHQVGRVRRLRVLARGHSGRATKLAIQGSRGRVVVHGELTIRRLLGNLKSSMFVHQRQRLPTGQRVWQLLGGGWGHGVGMCQTGAIGRAAAKQAYRKILAHYYRGTRLLSLY